MKKIISRISSNKKSNPISNTCYVCTKVFLARKSTTCCSNECRLVKYIEKGFKIDKNQRLFFAELVRSNLYSPELEAITAY